MVFAFSSLISSLIFDLHSKIIAKFLLIPKCNCIDH